jgi:hypothetical protein
MALAPDPDLAVRVGIVEVIVIVECIVITCR